MSASEKETRSPNATGSGKRTAEGARGHQPRKANYSVQRRLLTWLGDLDSEGDADSVPLSEGEGVRDGDGVTESLAEVDAEDDGEPDELGKGDDDGDTELLGEDDCELLPEAV